MQQHPNRRPKMGVRELAARLTNQQARSGYGGTMRKATLDDAFFLIAFLLKSVSMYDADHHKAVNIISNYLPATFAGFRRARNECRHMQEVMLQDIEWHTAKQPRFFMRGEFRFMGDRLQQAIDDDLPDVSQISRAHASRLLMQQVVALVFYFQFELFNIGLRYKPDLTAVDLLVAPSLELGSIDAILAGAQHVLHTTSGQALRHLGLETMLKLHRHLARARAMLFACSATELAVIEATTCLFELSLPPDNAHHRPLKPSLGATRAINKLKRALAPEDQANVVPPTTKPRSLLELWRLIGQTFKRGTEIVALLHIMGVSVMVEGEVRKRQGRAQLMHTLAQEMSTNCNDPTAIALARRIYPRLPANLVEEVVAAGGPQPAP